ncbi:hypothetical protein BLAT2472_80337 [Burkholderia latens]
MGFAIALAVFDLGSAAGDAASTETQLKLGCEWPQFNAGRDKGIGREVAEFSLRRGENWGAPQGAPLLRSRSRWSLLARA